MSFLLPSVAALGAGLMLLPLAVHLLSRRKRKRIAWGAMEFLLTSSRRNQHRSSLEEWLLLLLRALVMLLAGLVAAGPHLPRSFGGPQSFGGWFRTPKTTHLVVLDDSYSMGEQADGTSRWQSACQAVERLAERTAGDSQNLVLLRSSDTVTPTEEQTAPHDLDRLETTSTSHLATNLMLAMAKARHLAEDVTARGDTCYGYLLTDLRRHDLTATEFTSSLETFNAEVKGLVLGHCAVPTTRVLNLSVSHLAFEPGPLAAGIEGAIRIVVRNQGDLASPRIPMSLRRGNQVLTTVEIEPLEPGESTSQEVPILLASTGVEKLVAQLPEDALAEDNQRWIAMEVPPLREVLLIDGSHRGREGRAFSAALAPGSTSPTGWQPRLVSRRELHSLGDLAQTAVVLLLDVSRLDRQADEQLTRFVSQGGGLLNVLGPSIEPDDYNAKLVAGRAPWLPAKLDLPAPPPWVEPKESMLRMTPHRTLRVFSGKQSGFLPLVRIARYYALEETHAVGGSSSPQGKSLLRLTDDTPLLLAHSVGQGRVITLLTTAAAKGESPGTMAWSNLATLPLFPILVNEVTGWLAEPRLAAQEVAVGEPALVPHGATSWALSNQAGDDAWQTLRTESHDRHFPVLKPGIYRTDGAESTLLFAANPDPQEGQLAAITLAEARDQFGDIAEVLPVGELFLDERASSNQELVAIAGMALLALLIAERLLATRCSHLRAVPVTGGRHPL